MYVYTAHAHAAPHLTRDWGTSHPTHAPPYPLQLYTVTLRFVTSATSGRARESLPA